MRSSHPDDGGSKPSDMSVSMYQTMQCNIPEDDHLHAHYCENQKSLVTDTHCSIVKLESKER